MFCVYVFANKIDKRCYVGRTKNLRRRTKEHSNGKVWTTKRMKKIKLVFFEAFLSEKDAIRRERYLKTSKGRSTLKQMLRYSLE